jgi:hypothetical protein
MKKMVWVFGQPGAGRTSIISELTSNGEVSESLDLKDQRIKYIDIPYDKDSNSCDYSYFRTLLARYYILARHYRKHLDWYFAGSSRQGST